MITLLLFITLLLWSIIGIVTFCLSYLRDTSYGIKFSSEWRCLNRLQKRFVFVAHGPVILIISTVALTIRKTYNIINSSYTTVLDILGKQTDHD